MLQHFDSKSFKYRDRSNMQIMLAIKEDDTIIDIGCGFDDNAKHRSISNSFGLDLNFEHGKIKVKYPIMGDAQHIPIKDNVFPNFNCQALLEHLKDPDQCMREINRITKDDAKGFILIPIDSRQIPQTLKRFIKEFPFSFKRTVINLIKSVTLWKLEGMLHIKQISLNNIRKHFKIDKVMVKKHDHFWFAYHYPRFILRKFLGINRMVKVNEYSEFYIWCSKK